MSRIGKIITVGLCPCWDTTYHVDGIDWDSHKTVSSSNSHPAGKSLNVSRALAWLNQTSTAAGLWGRDDYEQMLKETQPLRKFLKVKMTPAPGQTRRNITIIDTVNKREMHLRSKSELAAGTTLRKLKTDLSHIVKRNNICVFAGSLPPKELQNEIAAIIESCHGNGAKIVIDSSGRQLSKIVNQGRIWLIKPNVAELSELVDREVKNTLTSIVTAAYELLDRVEIILISRGRAGAVVVTRNRTWHSRLSGTPKNTLSTVGCGDYLLAGFLKGLKDNSDIPAALETAIKTATAKAWSQTDTKSWPQTQRQIKIKVDTY